MIFIGWVVIGAITGLLGDIFLNATRPFSRLYILIGIAGGIFGGLFFLMKRPGSSSWSLLAAFLLALACVAGFDAIVNLLRTR